MPKMRPRVVSTPWWDDKDVQSAFAPTPVNCYLASKAHRWQMEGDLP